jgi:hypothetical protein
MAIDAAQASFGSTHSLYDYDLVLWDPRRSLQPYLKRGWGAGSWNGLTLLSEEQSPRLRRDLARRTNDFDEFIKLGRTFVVFLPGDLRVYIDSGERTHSGTGRNRQTTNVVKLLNIMDALPTRPARAATLGDAMQPAHSSIGPLYRQTADYWCYASVFDEAEDLRPLLRVSGTTKLAAAHTDHEGGTIILLPILLTGTPDEDDEDEDDYEHDEEDQSEDAEAGDATAPPAEAAADASSNDELDPETVDKMLLEWLIRFTSSEEVVWPDWADEYRLRQNWTGLQRLRSAKPTSQSFRRNSTRSIQSRRPISDGSYSLPAPGRRSKRLRRPPSPSSASIWRQRSLAEPTYAASAVTPASWSKRRVSRKARLNHTAPSWKNGLPRIWRRGESPRGSSSLTPSSTTRR